MNRARQLWATDRGRLAHYVVAGALAIFMLVETATNEVASPGLVAAAAVGAVALLLTRDAPFVAPLVVSGALVAVVGIGADEVRDSGAPFLVAVLFVPWCFGAYNERRRAVAGLLVAEAVGVWANTQFSETTEDYFWVAVLIGVSWTAGFVMNSRTEHARTLAERARELEQRQREAAERAVAEERQRIARELHDVIAHSVSVMTVQAGAVRRLLRPEQEREREALEAVEATGREALTEMRRLVGLLKDSSAMPEYAPQPGLRTIDALLETVRQAGLPVALDVDGRARELPPGLDLAAYRIVQEALTNALRYAGPAQAWVSLRWTDGELGVEVANDGRDDWNGPAGGHGLAGMRERLSLYGGEIETGPREGGGYVVRARIPIGEELT